MRPIRRLFLSAAAVVAALIVAIPAGAHTPYAKATKPVISDIHAFSFSVSWATPTATTGKVQVQMNGKWTDVPEMRGTDVKSTTHLFSVPCNLDNTKTCTARLKPKTRYKVRVTAASNKVINLKATTTADLKPATQISAVASKVVGANQKPIANALVYVVVHTGSQKSVPLAVLTLATGGWLVALPNAVTKSGQSFPLNRTTTVAITVLTGTGRASEKVKVTSLNGPMILKPIVVK